MKKIVLVAAFCSTVAAFAKPVPLVAFKFADTTKISLAAAALGEAMGERAFGASVTAMLVANPVAQLLGPMRDNAQLAVFTCVDDAVTNGLQDVVSMEAVNVAAIYPLSKGKDALLTQLSAVASEGYYKIGECDNAEMLEDLYFKVSDDGKWLALSDKRPLVDYALGKIGFAAKPINDGVCEVLISGKAFDLLADCIVEADPEGKGTADTLRSIRSCRVVLNADKNGLYFKETLTPAAGSVLSRIGTKTLPQEPFAYAPANAMAVREFAANSGALDGLAFWDKYAKLLTDNGFDLSSIAVDRAPGRLGFTVDLKALFAYVSGPATNVIAKIEPQKFVGSLKKAVGSNGVCENTPALASYLVLKGCPTPASPASRFNALLGSAKSRPAFQRDFFSFYSLLRAMEPSLLSLLGEEERAMLKPLVAQLPKPGNGGIAMTVWREKDNVSVELRISPDEITGISTCFSVGMGYYMYRQMSAVNCIPVPGCEDDDEDDDDEDGDDSDE